MLRAALPVHAGGSGGALITPCGALAGLVTSNSRLNRGSSAAGGGGGAGTLPTLNFSVSGPALRSLCAAARAQPAGGAPTAELAAACAQLDAPDERARAAWALQEARAVVPGAGPRLADFLRRSRL
jgi:hypothetical protein